MKIARRNLKHVFLACLVVTAFLSMIACTKHVYINTPLDVSRAGQIVKVEFKTTNPSDIRAALLFVISKNRSERETQDNLWGDIYNDGIPIDIHLRVVSGTTTFFDERIRTTGTYAGMAICHAQKRLNTAVRLIKNITLPPGTYSVEVRTLTDKASLKTTESYVQFITYDPKH